MPNYKKQKHYRREPIDSAVQAKLLWPKAIKAQ